MFNRLYGPTLAPKADRLGTYAAALAYCLVLSLIPFLVVTFTLAAAITHLDLVEAYNDLLQDILPGDARTSLSYFSTHILHTLEGTSRGQLATIGYVFAVYTSFNLMTQIVRTLLFIFDDARRPMEWNLRLGLKSVALLFVWMFLLLVLSLCSLLTPVVRHMLEQAHLNPALWGSPLLFARYFLELFSLFGAFFFTYRLVPSKRYPLVQIRNGSLVASLGWVICSEIFARLLPSIWHTNAVYEALGSIVIILIWAQACAWMVILGACWIVRFPHRKKSKSLRSDIPQPTK